MSSVTQLLARLLQLNAYAKEIDASENSEAQAFSNPASNSSSAVQAVPPRSARSTSLGGGEGHLVAHAEHARKGASESPPASARANHKDSVTLSALAQLVEMLGTSSPAAGVCICIGGACVALYVCVCV